MSKLIKIFLIILFALAVSCKSNENPDSGGEIAGENPPAGEYTGDYTGEKGTVTINEDGSCTIDGTIIVDPYNTYNSKTTITFNITVKSWYRSYNGTYYGYNNTRDFVINSFTGGSYTLREGYFYWGVNSYSGKSFLAFSIDTENLDGVAGFRSLTLKN